MGFKRILAAIRTTSGPSAVFEQALKIAKKEEARLMLYHCLQPETLAEYADRIVTVSELDSSRVQETYSARVKTEIEHHRSWLETLCRRAGDEGIQARCLVEEGRAGRRIIELSKRWEADLIVLGRTRRGSIADVLFGTVSDYVIHHAKCSLLLVQ